MSGLYSVLGTSNPSYLLADPQGADVIAISCEPNNGALSRGQIMYQKVSGMWAPAATGNILITNMLAVLDEAVDTDADALVAEDAKAFRAGRLIGSKLIVASSGTLTAAHKVVLRAQGITLDVMDDADMDFSNVFVVVTYKANGGTGADLPVNVQKGTAYAIAANAFTPPSGKVFSKWNTLAAGTGTDFAPAASYTANANLTLYAVWVDEG